MNINCTLDCKHQECGMCTLYKVPLYISGLSEKCMYYLPKDENKILKSNEHDKIHLK